MSIYDFKAINIDGEEVTLEKYKGKVLVIVNTASKCGFTPQYSDLEKIYEKYSKDGLEILGFPSNQFSEQEPGNNNEVKSFCMINYGVTFPMFEKIDVRGANAHPIFKYLTMKAPYQGIDQSNMSGKILHKFLNEELPDYLVGDSIKWNFTKFLIDREGNVIGRYESPVEPMDMVKDITKALI
jgi:glutathione peroxidase